VIASPGERAAGGEPAAVPVAAVAVPSRARFASLTPSRESGSRNASSVAAGRPLATKESRPAPAFDPAAGARPSRSVGGRRSARSSVPSDARRARKAARSRSGAPEARRGGAATGGTMPAIDSNGVIPASVRFANPQPEETAPRSFPST